MSTSTELFQTVGSIDYPIVDADSHVNEPPDLWQESVQIGRASCRERV